MYLFKLEFSRDICPGVHSAKAVVLSIVLHRWKSWTIKKAECQRTQVFALWCWRRLLRVTWTARRSNQWILEDINPECSLEGLMLKLKLQYAGHLMQRVDSLEKTLMLRGIRGRRRRGWQMAGWHYRLDGHEFEWTPVAGDGQGGLVCCSPWSCKESDTTEQLNWTEDGASGKEPTCHQRRRHKRLVFHPWVGKIPWRREWQPTPVFLPGESHGQRNLVGYSPRCQEELDTTEAT